MTPYFPQRTRPDRTALWLVFPFLLALSAPLACARTAKRTETLAAPAPAPAAPIVSSWTLTLPECLDVALQKQPRLAVERASLAAAEDGKARDR